MTTHCITCKTSLGLTRIHADGICPVTASLWCSNCSCYGHTVSGCEVTTHVTRPATLEELIPADVKARWGITTHTRILYPQDITLDDAEREIGEGSVIEIRYGSLPEGATKLDAAIRAFMKAQKPKIETVHKMEGNLIKLRLWAVAQGKKIRLVQET